MVIQGSNTSQKHVKIFVVIATYWAVSISTVFINKWLFNYKVGLNTPIFITWMQCVVSTCICVLWRTSAKLFPKSVSFPSSKPFSTKVITAVAPVSILYVFTIGFSNLSLSFVGVSFYYVSRSLTTVFNVIFTYIILSEKTSFRAILCCLVIIFGFVLGVDQENFIGTFSFRGTAFGVFSSVALSLYSIFTKKVLPALNSEVILLTFYNNIYSSILFLPVIFLNGELGRLLSHNLNDPLFWLLVLISGVFGFLIGFITALQIKVTSPLTHNISGTAKACTQTVIATYWYKEVKSVLWWISNFLVLFGSAAYARVRQLEMLQKN